MSPRSCNYRAVRYIARYILLCLLLTRSCWPLLAADTRLQNGKATWYKGNTHAHSFWSDGDEFPEMVADWYKSHGYQFLCMSDHNVLMRGPRWLEVRGGQRSIPDRVMAKCQDRFGPGWVETRVQNGKQQVRLKTLADIRQKLEQPGKFLMMENQEITGDFDGKEIHVNAINLASPIGPQSGANLLERLRRDLAAVNAQAQQSARPILAQVNHPNRRYSITPEQLAQATETRFFEVCNAGPDCNFFGDKSHPGTERMWDVANNVRLGQLKQPPLYGIASDDAHRYHVFAADQANPGRAWIMVRAKALTANALLQAMSRGDFYATTGVMLREVSFDASTGKLDVAVQEEPGVQYRIEFIGTLTDSPEKSPEKRDGKIAFSRPIARSAPMLGNSTEVGKVLATFQGSVAGYQLTGQELYVRAVVRSNKKMANASRGGVQFQNAWTQPVGWEKRHAAR